MLPLVLACAPDEPVKSDSPADSHADSTTDSPTTDSPTTDSPTTETGEETGETGTTDPGPHPAVAFDGDRPTNLIVISVDTTRRDQLGVFTGLDTTPFFDSVLAESVLLADHRTCSNWTIPSVLCATTGFFPLDEGWWPTSTYDGYGDPLIAGIPDSLPTVAQILSDAGYATGLVTGNPLITTANNGVVSGYQTVVNRGWSAAPVINASGTVVSRQLLGTGQPWYLHLHYMDPHGPYTAPESYATDLEELRAKYPDFPWDVTNSSDAYTMMWYWPYLSDEDAAIAHEFFLSVYRAELRYWDDNLSEMFDTFETLGMLDDTLVVFWTDHGEQFGEHDGFQHGVSLHAQENRSTAAFWAPNIVPAVWEGPTLHQDVPPTILEAMGLPAAPEHTGLVAGMAPDDRTRITFDYLVGYAPVLISAIREDRQLYYNYAGPRYYYDLSSDPEGDTSVYDSSDPTVLELWGELDPYLEWLATNWTHLTPLNPEP